MCGGTRSRAWSLDVAATHGVTPAVDARETLPNAVLYGETPDYYEGSVDAFLQDADRAFKSVTRRLQAIITLQSLDPK